MQPQSRCVSHSFLILLAIFHFPSPMLTARSIPIQILYKYIIYSKFNLLTAKYTTCWATEDDNGIQDSSNYSYGLIRLR